jgi:hypothetical protein
MNKERVKSLKVGTKVGALAGAIVFVVFGIVPGFYFGSYGTMVMLSHLFGGPMEPNLITRVAVVVGTLLGIFCMASVSIVVGSVVGTALAWAAELVTSPMRKPAAEQAKAE